jgi:hypothetical protein
MAVRSKGAPRRTLGLWQEPTFALFWRPDLVAVKVSATDPDLLPALANEFVDIEPLPRGQAGQARLKLLACHRPMYAELCSAWHKLQKQMPESATGVPCLHLHGAARLLGSGDIGLVFGSAPASTVNMATGMEPAQATLEKARGLLAAHRAAEIKAETQRLMAAAKAKTFLEQLSPEASSKVQGVVDAGAAVREFFDTPLPSVEPLLTELSWALAFKTRTSDPEAICRAAEREIRRHPGDHHPAPADGSFAVMMVGRPKDGATGFVSWAPNRGQPSYAEIRAAVEQTIAAAFARPRLTGAHPPPYIEGIAGSQAEPTVAVGSVDFPGQGDLEQLAELPEPDLPDYEVRAKRARDFIGEAGFEAIAWYQSHHHHTDDAWGIFVDAERLDDFVSVIADDLIREGFTRRPMSIAQTLALPLVFEHELFHARVDAVLTWVELLRQRPAYLAYSKDVYLATRDTEGAVEEALANFWAWSLIFTDLNLRWLIGLFDLTELGILNRVVSALLDLSPPGYRDWRSGHSSETWRLFGTHALRGAPRLPRQGMGLPIESMFRDPLQFMLQRSDVPLHVIGRGQAIRAFLSSPATFNVPARAELRRVLERVFGYREVPGQGKGSHVKYVSPDGRMFPLPQKDPVSRTVFSSFLEHVGLSKAEYVAKVRTAI